MQSNPNLKTFCSSHCTPHHCLAHIFPLFRILPHSTTALPAEPRRKLSLSQRIHNVALPDLSRTLPSTLLRQTWHQRLPLLARIHIAVRRSPHHPPTWLQQFFPTPPPCGSPASLLCNLHSTASCPVFTDWDKHTPFPLPRHPPTHQ